MGSCENSVEVHEPSHWSANEQHPCLIKKSDSQQLPCLEGGCRMTDVDVGPTCARDKCLEICQNAGCTSSCLSIEMEIVPACESENVVGWGPDKLSGNECKVIGGYLEEKQSGILDCNVETNGLSVKKLESGDQSDGLANSLEDYIQSKDLGIASVSGSLLNQSDELKEDMGGDIQVDMEEKSNDLANMDSKTCDQMMPSSDCTMPADIRPMNGSCSNQVELDNQDGSASVESVMVVLKDKSAGLLGVEADYHNPVRSLLDPKTLLESIPTLDPPSNYVQQGVEKDDQIIDSSSAEETTEVIQNENVYLHVTEVSACNELLCDQGFDKSLALMPVFDSPEKRVKQDEQKGDRPFNLSCEKRVAETISNNQILPSLDGEGCLQSDSFSCFPRDCSQQNDLETMTLSSVSSGGAADGKIDALAAVESDLCTQKPVDDLLGDSSRKNELRDDKVINDSFEENVPDVVEEESDVTTEIKGDIQEEADACREHAPEIALYGPQSCQPFNDTEHGASRRLHASHPVGKAVFGTISPSIPAESCELKDNEGEDLARKHKTGCSSNGSSSCRRSSQKCTSSQKTQTKRASRKCKNKEKVQDLQIFKAERRRRTCFSKPARSSNWGLLGNIQQFFELSNGLRIHEIVPSKKKVGRESRKRNKSRASGSSKRPSGKKHAPTTGIRLKVKLGNEVCQTMNLVVPEVLDTSAFAGVSNYDAKSDMKAHFEVRSFANGNGDKMGEDEMGEQLKCLDSKLEKAKIHSDASISDLHVPDKDLEGTVISQKTTGNTAGDCLGLLSHAEVEDSGGEIEKGYTDPGTSPDSEVINSVPESQTNTRCQEDFPDAIIIPSRIFDAPRVVSSSKNGEKKNQVSYASDSFQEDVCPQMARTKKVKTKKKQGRKENKGDGFFSSENLASSASANASSNSLSSKEFSEELFYLSSKDELLVSGEAVQADISAENNACCGLDAGHKLSESQHLNHLLPSTKSKGSQLPKKSSRACDGKSKDSDKAKSKRENGCKQRGNERKSVKKNKIKEKSDRGDLNCKREVDPVTVAAGNCAPDDIGKTNPDDNVASTDEPNMAASNIVEQHVPDENAWVRCDDCHKWRRIPVALVDSIGQTNCQWVCKDNKDKAFADCSITQEKSNAEINAELGLSDADEDAYDAPSKNKGLECKRAVSKEHEFMRISANQFRHRSRKTQTIDEIMVCHCKLPLDSGLGCGDECLNRMLNIECVQGTCPCGDRCSNQQFQKRNYAKMKWDRCGKKGFGLRLEEDISKGQFLIEYVGEVLDMHTYEGRQKEYAFKGHKHFYFMTLNGSEVIDACAKGNLGRFINHSCDPNCRTEKWVVNGEICIGLFALRDIKKDEEVTFDYNYVRVVGAAAKKCYCGSSHCRGYIGGDPTSTEVIDQVDSDEEFLEPVMLEDGEAGFGFKHRIPRAGPFNDVEYPVMLENGEAGFGFKQRIPRAGPFNDQLAECVSKDKNKTAPRTADVKLEVASEIGDSINESVSAIPQLRSSIELDDMKGNFSSSCQPVEVSGNSDDGTSKTVAAKQEISIEGNQRCETSPTTSLSKLSSDGVTTKLKSKSSTTEEKRVFVKSRFLIKTSSDSCSSKKGKLTNSPLNVNKVPVSSNKSQVPSIKPKKLINGTSNGRFEAVEEKLNELLDVDGGISKRKDAAKGYLKFLLLTAASGASGNGEAIQSNRDLSMILDALLKTKSRVVLIDIINKNGLRMLHNMMKQYRRDFKKTPILRKLLKVLEYLAARQILTQEHINGGPPCAGMESFRESILSLTEHDDKQVHQIARNFRDRWIPRHGRRFGNLDRDDGRMDFHKGSISNRVSASQNHLRDLAVRPTEAIDSATQPKLATASVDTAVNDGCSPPCLSGGTKSRKRKSRWDQPAPEKLTSSSLQHEEQKSQSGLRQQSECNPPPIKGKEVSDHVEKGTREGYCPDCASNYYRQNESSFADDGRQNIQSDAPPGFSSPINSTLVSPSASSTITDLPQRSGGLMFPVGMVVGCPQKKFISHLSVSYGIPMPIMQQLGSPRDGTMKSWAVAPGMPFHPFPPLPPFPHNKNESPYLPAVDSMVIDGSTEEGQQRRVDPSACDPDENNPSTTGSNQPDLDIPVENGQQTFKRARASSDLGKRYFRQQKWNKVPPPWIRNRDGWGYLGNNSRGGICTNDVESVPYEHKNSYCSKEVSCRVEKAGNCINQQNSTLN